MARFERQKGPRCLSLVACPANAGSDHSKRRADGGDWMIWREDPHAVRQDTGHSAAVQGCGNLEGSSTAYVG